MEFTSQEGVVITRTIVQGNDEAGLYCWSSDINISDSQISNNPDIGINMPNYCDIVMINVEVCGNVNDDISCDAWSSLIDNGGNKCAPTGLLSWGVGSINCNACH